MTDEKTPPTRAQASQPEAQELAERKAAPSRGKAVQEFAIAALAVLLYLLLADAGVETLLSRSPGQWVILGTVAVYFVASAALSPHLSWATRAAGAMLLLLALGAETAWLPGGLSQGLMLLRQPTSTVLAALTAGGILLAAVIVAGWRFVPLWGRAAVGFLALYGVAGAGLGIRATVPYAALFHGGSEWQRLPVWLQGVVVGAGLLAATFLIHLGYGLVRIRGRRLRTWGLEAAALALVTVIAAAGFVRSPASIQVLVPGGGPAPIPSPTPPGPGPAPAPSPSPSPTPQPPAPSPPQPGSENLLSWERGAVARVWPVDTDPDVPASGVLFNKDWQSKKGTSGAYTFVFELPAQAMIERLAFMAGRNPDTRARTVHGAVSIQSPDTGYTDAGTFTLQDTSDEQAFSLPRPTAARWIRVTIEPRPGGETTLSGVLAYGRESLATPSSSLSGAWVFDDYAAYSVSADVLLGSVGRLPTDVSRDQYRKKYGRLQLVQEGDHVSGVRCAETGVDASLNGAEDFWQGTRSGGSVRWKGRGAEGAGVANAEGTLLVGRFGGYPFIAIKSDTADSCVPAAVGNGKKVLLITGWNGAAGRYPPVDHRADYSGYRFVTMPTPLLRTSELADADSAVLAYLCDAGIELADWQKGILLDFVKDGHKLIIHDSDLCAPKVDYGFLPYPFATSNPGAHGARGDRLILVEPSPLGTDDRRDVPHFIDPPAYAAGSNQLGDANVVTSQDEHWCGHLFGTNALHANGFMHMYARYGSGLIIYNGLDRDDGLGGNPHYHRLAQLELAASPSTRLPCTQSVAARFLVAPSQTTPFVPGRAQRIRLRLEVLANQGYAGTVSLSPKAPDSLPWNFSLSSAQVILHGDTAPVDLVIDVPPAATGNTYEVPVAGTDADGHTASAVITLVAKAPEQVQVIEEQGRIRIVLPAAILFDFDKFKLKPSAEAALTRVKGPIIDRYPGAHLIVEGHTDDRGTQAYNQTLGAQRAQSVAGWLTGHGIPAPLVETKSYGKNRPRCLPPTTEENRTCNRRVEIIVVK